MASCIASTFAAGKLSRPWAVTAVAAKQQHREAAVRLRVFTISVLFAYVAICLLSKYLAWIQMQ
jgi:hypothetical protein